MGNEAFCCYFLCKKKNLITESQNMGTKILKKSLPQLKRVRITLHLKFCALLIQQNIPPNYLKKQILKMGSKKTTLIISKKEKKKSTKNHTILSTYQELIKQERQTKKTYHHYTCTELHTCFETFVMIIILHSVLQLTKLLYLLIIIILKRKLLTSS